MKYTIFTFFVLAALTVLSCSKPFGNPVADGFDASGSDAKAVAIADEVMEAMGGREAWDATRYLTWNFFGSRIHKWDKLTGQIKIVSPKDNYILWMNLDKMEGRLMMDDKMVTHPDSLAKYIEKGKSAWINDSYWLVMPYKLKDTGVTLKYKGERKTEKGEMADVLELTFKNVGNTPDNKYEVYVDKTTHLVTQWDFYAKYDDPKPRFSTPWDGYKKYGNILLSGGRGKYQLTDIGAPARMPMD